jgi:hypothetical protein
MPLFTVHMSRRKLTHISIDFIREGEKERHIKKQLRDVVKARKAMHAELLKSQLGPMLQNLIMKLIYLRNTKDTDVKKVEYLNKQEWYETGWDYKFNANDLRERPKKMIVSVMRLQNSVRSVYNNLMKATGTKPKPVVPVDYANPKLSDFALMLYAAGMYW